jgi:hypothetical protein
MTGGGMNGRPKRPGLVKKDDDEEAPSRYGWRASERTMESSEEEEYEETTEERTA